MTEDDIREFFAECGDIASVRAAAAALEVTLLFNALYIRVDVVAISLSPDFLEIFLLSRKDAWRWFVCEGWEHALSIVQTIRPCMLLRDFRNGRPLLGWSLALVMSHMF